MDESQEHHHLFIWLFLDYFWRNIYSSKNLNMVRGGGTSVANLDLKKVVTTHKIIYISIIIRSATIDLNLLALDNVDYMTTISL